MKKLSILLLFFVTTLSFAQTPSIPPKTDNLVNDFAAKTDNLVNDFADVLSDDEESRLRELSRSIQKESSAQVVIVTTDDVPKEYPIEKYSLDLAQSWGIGQRGVDNGVLILVCPINHKSRIEVGPGLEGLLTDAWTSRLQREHFNPNFRKFDFYTGLKEAVELIKTQISPEAQQQLADLKRQQEKESAELASSFLTFFMWLIIIAAIIAVVVYSIRKANAEKRRKREEAEAEERAKQRIINNARNEEAILNDTFRKVSSELTRMQGFYNADAILTQVTELYNKTKASLPDAIYQDYQTICRPCIDEIKKLSKTLIDNYNIKQTVIKNSENFKNDKETVLNRINDAVKVLQHVEQMYDADVWKDVTNFRDLRELTNHVSTKTVFDHITKGHQNAINLAETGNFATAITESQRVKSMFDAYQEKCSKIFNKEKELKNSTSELSKYVANNTIAEKVAEVSRYIKNNVNDISHHLKRDWNDFSHRSTHFVINVRTNNPFNEMTRVYNFKKEIEEFLNKAKREVELAERKRRQERDEEESRQRRIREAAYTSSAIYSASRSDDSSYSSSSSSSSNDSMGGGSFSGGGSSNDW